MPTPPLSREAAERVLMTALRGAMWIFSKQEREDESERSRDANGGRKKRESFSAVNVRGSRVHLRPL